MRTLPVGITSVTPMSHGIFQQVAQQQAQTGGVQILRRQLRSHLQHDLVVIPKTTHLERMCTNADVSSFVLTDEQMAALDALDRGLRTGSHPDRIQE